MITLPSKQLIIQSTGRNLSLWQVDITVTLVPSLRYLRIFDWKIYSQTEWFFINDPNLGQIQRALIQSTETERIFAGTCKDFLPTGLTWYPNPYNAILGSDTGSIEEQKLAGKTEIQDWFKKQAAFRFVRLRIGRSLN
jgi:hypothetical protein